jgi:hypothetical protein
MTHVHSSRLQFTPDGRTLVVAERDGVSVVELHGHGRRRIAISEVQAIAAFADQFWVATRTGVLHRLGADGRQLDEHPLPIDPEGALIPTTIGGPSALWTGRESVMLVDDLGRFSCLPVHVDAAIPIVGRRFVHYAGARLTLPAGTPVTLASGAQVAGGCVILDGTSLAVVAEHPHGRSVVVLVLASGSALRTVAVPAGTIRIAARRGLAVVQDAARRLVLVDLRFGRHLGVVVADDDVTDVAIDPDGQLLVLRVASGELELAPIGDRRGPITRLSVAREGVGVEVPEPEPSEVETDDAPTEEPAAIEPPAVELPAVELPAVESLASALRSVEALTVVRVDALEPRPLRDRLPRPQALAELDRELWSVTLRAARAISRAWDSHRLGYGNESHHPYEHEVAAIVGQNTGFAADHVEKARAALVEHERMLAADPMHRGPSTPVAELRDEFGLSPAAVDVLLVIAAPSLEGDIARLYGILKNDPGRMMCDELIVRAVLADRVSRHDITAALKPHAPLVRLGIIHVEPSQTGPFAALEVDEVVLSRLRGEPLELGMMPVVRAADRELAELALAPGVLMSAVDALTQAPRPARIAVRGRAGTGRRTLLAAFAHKAGRALGVIDATRLPRDAERFVRSLHAALSCAQLAGLLPVVDGLDAVVLGERTGGELAGEVLDEHPGPLAVLTLPGASPPLPIGHVVIDLPALSETERLAVWERALDGSGHWLRDAAGLAARYRVGPGVIHRALAVVVGTESTTPCDDRAGTESTTPCDDRIEAFLRQSRDVRLSGHARRVERLAGWSNLVLPSDIMDSLREFVGRVRHRRKVFEDWDMSGTMSTSRGLTALFQGQPGTGKTLVAGVIARELGLDLYRVDLSKVMSKWIGETERNLATIFDAAEDGQVILLFDEADSLFGKRTEVRSSNDRYANLEVNYLLQRLDAFEGIAMLTTNSGGAIDPAFKRRLSFQLSFPFPDEETRAALWRAHLPPSLPRGEELVFDELARKYQISGGYIRNACLRAAFLAAQEDTVVYQHHLERAVALEFAEMGKLSTTGTIA